MELVLEPDLYSPSIDDIENYVDKIPSFHIIKKGLLCPCGSRKDKIYDTYIKTKTHQKWLANLNLNKANFYAENIKLTETIQNQRLIISKLEKDVNSKSMTIDYLTQQLHLHKPTTVNNLLEFD